MSHARCYLAAISMRFTRMCLAESSEMSQGKITHQPATMDTTQPTKVSPGLNVTELNGGREFCESCQELDIRSLCNGEDIEGEFKLFPKEETVTCPMCSLVKSCFQYSNFDWEKDEEEDPEPWRISLAYNHFHETISIHLGRGTSGCFDIVHRGRTPS